MVQGAIYPYQSRFPWKLHKLIKQHRPDILHLHLPNPSAFWVLALSCSRALPWVVQWQSDVLTPASSPVLKWFYRLYRPLENALLKRARRIIATSEQYRLTSPVLQAFSDKTTVVPLGIADRFDTSESQKTVAQPQPAQRVKSYRSRTASPLQGPGCADQGYSGEHEC